MADKILEVSEPDFFTIKQNLINYLKNQSQFSDYNFSGSGFDVILDILAYNTFYQTVYTNFGISETFLDSAVQRGSIVSAAKQLGYVPRSTGAADAIISISFSVSGNPPTYVLPKNTAFTATLNSTTYTFVTDQDYSIVNNGQNIYTEDIAVYQGVANTYTYTVNLNDGSQRFIVPSLTADLSFLVVSIADTGSSEYIQYQNVKDANIGSLDGDSTTYFIKEAFDGYFEVYFGDGIVGKNLSNGNIIKLEYLITQGKEANGIRQFSLGSTLPNTSNFSTITIQAADGGDDKETTESIKFLAPFYYQAQGRAITEDDYKSVLLNALSGITDAKVWGGEKNDPPYYGRVFIALKPKFVDYFSNTQKAAIETEIIAKFNVVSIIPKVVDPQYITVDVDTTVTYNSRLNNAASVDLTTTITSAINELFESDVNKFGQPLYYSKLMSAINDSSNIILSTVLDLTLNESASIYVGVAASYIYTFNNALTPGTIKSNAFLVDDVTWYIKDIQNASPDNTTGKLVVYNTSESNIINYLSTNIGSVDYNTGKVTITNIRIDSIVEDAIDNRLVISAVPGPFINTDDPTKIYQDFNVYSNEQSQIIVAGGISVTLIPDSSA